MSVYRDRAVVLRTYKFGEADRIVVLLTQHAGKVRAVAKGVRKTGSRIGARLEPLSHVEVQLWRGKELDTVRQVDLIDTHSALRGDYDRVSQGLSMAEAVDKLTPDREPVEHLYVMLSRALISLNAHNSPLMLGAFYWKVLAAEGVHPQYRHCVRCGGVDGLCAFDVIDGGVTCGSCRAGVSVSGAAIDLLAMVLEGGLSEALATEENPAVHEVNELAKAAMEHHLERRIKSLQVFDRHL